MEQVRSDTIYQQVVDRSFSRVRVQSDRMEQVRSDTIYEWSSGISTIGPIPRNLQTRILTRLAQSFTHRDNPYENSNPNIAFQRDLDEAMEADDEYRTNPSLPRLCHLLAELAYKWEKIESQSRRMSGSTSTQSLDTKKKTSSYLLNGMQSTWPYTRGLPSQESPRLQS